LPFHGEVHGPGYPAFPYKLRTGLWQLFGGTTTHQSLPLDETAPKNWVSRSRWDRIVWNSVFPRILSFKTNIFFPKIDKIIKKKIVGLHPAPPPYGAAPHPPTKVGAKCLSAVVLDNPDRALCLTHLQISPTCRFCFHPLFFPFHPLADFTYM